MTTDNARAPFGEGKGLSSSGMALSALNGLKALPGKNVYCITPTLATIADTEAEH